MYFHRGLLFVAASAVLMAQPVSSYRYTAKGDEKTIEITNVVYDLTQSDLVTRSTSNIKRNLGDIGVEATTTIEAWKLGADLKTKPVYTVKSQGTESRLVNGEVFAISAGLEEVEWWRLYSAATGARLLDTYVPLVVVDINRESLTWRYIGLEVPGDESKNMPLKDPRWVAMVRYASSEKVIREVLITCDDPKLAAQLRSFADEERTMTVSPNSVRIVFSPSYPAPPSPVTVTIPIAKDDLDVAHAQVPAKVHAAISR
jgi:hypothetical protein